jgi:hypothetical protein
MFLSKNDVNSVAALLVGRLLQHLCFLFTLLPSEKNHHVVCPTLSYWPWVIFNNLWYKSKSKLSYDQRSVGQSVLVSGHHQGPWPIFLSPWNVFFRQLRVSYFVAPSLMRGRVCNLQLLQSLASAVPLGSESCETQDHIFQISETPPTWRARSPYLYPPGIGWPSYTPGDWIPFWLLLTTCRAVVEVFYPTSTWINLVQMLCK